MFDVFRVPHLTCPCTSGEQSGRMRRLVVIVYEDGNFLEIVFKMGVSRRNITLRCKRQNELLDCDRILRVNGNRPKGTRISCSRPPPSVILTRGPSYAIITPARQMIRSITAAPKIIGLGIRKTKISEQPRTVPHRLYEALQIIVLVSPLEPNCASCLIVTIGCCRGHIGALLSRHEFQRIEPPTPFSL